MTAEYIRYTVADPKRSEQLVAAYDDARQSLDKAPECLAYELSVCEEDPTSYILRIEWRSIEDHLNGFRKSANFPPFFNAIGGFVKEITEMRHYQLTLVHARK